MKRLFALLALCSLGLAAQAMTTEEEPKPKTKYICAIGGPVRTYTEEFKTRKECEDACLRAGIAGVCEETGAETDVVEGVEI